MASVAYVTTLTYASTNDRWALPTRPLLLAHWSVNQKLNHVSSVQIVLFSYVAPYGP